jgi:formyltetrahydrofolate-dependent phosphoribosylglycinamide formyltransferase
MVGAWQLPRAGTIENPLRIAIFISGTGSGMEALLNHQNRSETLHKTVIVICDKADAGGISKAQNHGVQIEVIEVPMHAESQQRRIMHEERIQAVLDKYAVEAVILSGYMRILTKSFVENWLGRMLNIHPSLLPKYPGAHAHRDALADGATEGGCTIHFVEVGVDSGPIIAQGEVPILPGDDEQSLAARVKTIEHIIYPQVLDELAKGNIKFP